MEAVKFSIIMVVYNSEKTLSKCLDSIIDQDFENFEIIIVNDGSKDKSFNICEKYKLKSRKIKVYNEEHKGLNSSRNLGIKESKGDYLLFVDPSDYMENNSMDILNNEIKEDLPDILFFGGKFKKPNRKAVRVKQPTYNFFVTDKEATYNDLENKNGIFGFLSLKAIKKEVILKNNIFFDETKEDPQGLFFACEIFKVLHTIKTIRKPLYTYTVTKDRFKTFSERETISFLIDFVEELNFEESTKIKAKMRNYECFFKEEVIEYLKKNKHEIRRKDALVFCEKLLKEEMFNNFTKLRKFYVKEVDSVRKFFILILLYLRNKHFLYLILHLNKNTNKVKNSAEKIKK